MLSFLSVLYLEDALYLLFYFYFFICCLNNRKQQLLRNRVSDNLKLICIKCAIFFLITY